MLAYSLARILCFEYANKNFTNMSHNFHIGCINLQISHLLRQIEAKQLHEFLSTNKVLLTYLRLFLAFLKAFWILFVQFPRLDQTEQKTQAIQNWSTETLKILGISVELMGSLDRSASKNSRLIVANHISWLDPLVIQTIEYSVFVAKQEVRDWPVIGWIAKGCDVIFVHRGSPSSARKMVQGLTQAMQKKQCIAGFPEGTSSEGHQVGFFHSNIFEAAMSHSCEVIAVSLRYRDLASKSTTLVPAFVGDTSFIQSLHRVICAPPILVQVVISEPIDSHGHTRRSLAQIAQSKVQSQLALLA
ncbi:MAG: 1-acyl-sn-glycerol-3-phosphate acyltransferase [Burkholderiales bacterium]|nr:1-acyl-sn-glycerol-3-phosphate acyltransferase [Burkholderiales bacterium]